MTDLGIADDGDVDDPIVWQVGKCLPDGRFRMTVCRQSDRHRLIAAFGEAWFVEYLAQEELELSKWGVN